MTIKAVSYNIQYGFGLDGAYDLERILAAVREADVICLQEVTRGYPKNGGVDMAAEIAAALPTHFSSFHPAADVDAGSAIVDGRAVDRRFQFGNMVLARWPLTAVRGHLLPRTWRKDKLNLQRGALEALIDTPAGPIRFYSIHLDHVDARERMAQIRALTQIAAEYPRTGGAVTGAAAFGLPEASDRGDYVVMGDFNCEPGTDEYRLLTEDSPIVDVTATDPGWSWRSPHDEKPVRRQRLDYAFCNHTLADRVAGARIDRDADGSDHMPVWIEIAD